MTSSGFGYARVGIYCRVPYIRDDDQTTVAKQELACREFATSVDWTVSAHHVFLDARRTAWKQQGPAPGWRALLDAVGQGELDVVVLYRPGSLLRWRADHAVMLIDQCEQRGVAIHTIGDDWPLDDEKQRERFRTEAERRLHTIESLSQLVSRKHEHEALAGRSHGGGRRAFGYSAGMGALVADEVAVVREVFARFLDGESLRSIAVDLNARGLRNSSGGTWSSSRVARVIDAPRYAGLRVSRGQIVRDRAGRYVPASWEPCISVEDWEQAHLLRSAKSEQEANRSDRHYLLTGMIECSRCGASMVGHPVGDYRMYACASASQMPPDRCEQHIGAASLEHFVQEAALRILEEWETPDDLLLAVTRNADESPARHRRITTRSAAALEGIEIGAGARASWRSASAVRRRAALAFLFAAVRIGQKTTVRGVFDTSRITLVHNN